MKLYIAADTKEKMQLGASLGAPAILTNSNVLLNIFGEDTTLMESAKKLLEDSDLTVFQSVHGRDAQEIVKKALQLHSISPKIGVKIIASIEGFKAIKILSEKQVKCIVTGLYTVGQSIMAAQVKAFAISPFFARGIELGLDMEKTISEIREVYDRLENPPEILAASIRTVEDALLAIKSGADGLALETDLLLEMIKYHGTDITELSFGKAFSKIKGEDVSYLDLSAHNEEDPKDFTE